MKTIVATLFALALAISAPAQAQNSATVLVIRQSNTGVLTIQQAPTPASYATTPPSGPVAQSFSDFTAQDGSIPAANPPQDFFWTLFESVLVRYPGQPLFLNSNNYMMVIWQTSSHTISLFVVADDPSLTGPYVAFTSSLSTVENAVRDKLYSGL